MARADRLAAFERLADKTLDRSDQDELLRSQTECTFVFSNADGWASGVVMSFVVVDGGFWLTAVGARAHVRALRRDPRVTIVVSNAGTTLDGRRMLSVHGVALVHRDPETKAWFFERFAARLQPADPRAFMSVLDTPNRVVIEVRPVAVVASHDSRKMPGDGRGLR